MPRAIHTMVRDAEARLGPTGAAQLAAEIRAKAHRLRLLRECPTPLDLAGRFDLGLVRTPALEVVNRAVQDTMRTRDGRLIVSMPPQEGKSNLIQWAIPHRLLENPEGRIGYASYAKSLARRGGRIMRNRIEDHLAPGLRIKWDHRDAADWEIDGHIGGVYSVGVEGGFTGRPVDEGLVVDDPLADLQAAESPATLANLFDWWSNVAQTRVWAGAWIIFIQTRWVENELVAKLIGDGWPYLNIPAQSEAQIPDALGRPPGEYMVSLQGRTTADWEKKRDEVGRRTWYALYQGVPSPPQGEIFQSEWFDRDRVSERPPGQPPIVMIDPADNPGTGDESGILVASVGRDKRTYIGPDYSGHYTVARWVRVALLAVVRHDAAELVFEQSLSGLARAITKGWQELRKQAMVLRDHAQRVTGASPAGPINPDVIETALRELAHPNDPASTWEEYREQLTELWPLTDGVLGLTKSGPVVRRIKPKGTKEWRAKAASSEYQHRQVSHIGQLMALEHQMTTWQPGQASPDRMDTAVHVVLLLSGASEAELVKPEGPQLPTRSTRSARHRSTIIPRSTLLGR